MQRELAEPIFPFTSFQLELLQNRRHNGCSDAWELSFILDPLLVVQNYLHICVVFSGQQSFYS